MSSKLGEICTIKYGKDHRRLANGNIPVYGSGGVMRYVDTALYKKKSVLIPRKGSLDKLYFLDKPFWTVDTLFYTEIDETKIVPEFLYFQLSMLNLASMNVGTAVPSLTTAVLNEIEIDVPPLPVQKAIAATLSCLDDMIELNNRTNKVLEEIAQTIFKRWFVDFEFPNEEGEPYKSSGGEMVDSELGEIPKGWKIGKLDDIIEIHDSKRIPLSVRKREQMLKIYPYYGASSLMDYVDDYIFDGLYILLGEDGTVVDDNGYPILQYVWGKFWVNNHAHVLKGINGFNEDSLYILLKNTNVQSIITGAVQLKINQANLKALRVIIPRKSPLEVFNQVLDPIFAEKRRLLDEIKKLESIRDTLLPKLMSGEIRVPVEEVV